MWGNIIKTVELLYNIIMNVTGQKKPSIKKIFLAIVLVVTGIVFILVFKTYWSITHVTMESLTADISRSSKPVDNKLQTIILGITNKEDFDRQFIWEKVQVSKRTQEGVRILELTVNRNPKTDHGDGFDKLFNSLKKEFGDNPEIRQSFDGFELRMIGVGVVSKWGKF